jgi:hypothetical protein
MSKRNNQRIELEREIESLDQFGRLFGELTARQEESYSRAIGKFLMAFSYLETSLDHMIITAISDRADERGYRVVKYLKFKDKVDYATGEYRRMISFIRNHRRKNRFISRLDTIIRRLEEIREFRNKVAHAHWTSLSESGFVRVKIQDESTGEGIQFVRVKITPQVMNRFSRLAISVANEIDEFADPSPLAFV